MRAWKEMTPQKLDTEKDHGALGNSPSKRLEVEEEKVGGHRKKSVETRQTENSMDTHVENGYVYLEVWCPSPEFVNVSHVFLILPANSDQIHIVHGLVPIFHGEILYFLSPPLTSTKTTPLRSKKNARVWRPTGPGGRYVASWEIPARPRWSSGNERCWGSRILKMFCMFGMLGIIDQHLFHEFILEKVSPGENPRQGSGTESNWDMATLSPRNAVWKLPRLYHDHFPTFCH